MKYLILILLLIFGLHSYAQYPFEKYPKPMYKVVPFNVLLQNDTQFVANSNEYKGYSIKLVYDGGEGSLITLYHKDKIIKQFETGIYRPQDTFEPDTPLYAVDLDGNGLIDFKLKIHNTGMGNANFLTHKLYFLNKGNNKFTVAYYLDNFDNDERDINGDGRCEVIIQNYVNYNNHSYWVFDLFNFRDGKLVNVSAANNYPILIQFLNRDNYKITNHFTRRQMRKFSVKTPEFFEYIK